MEQHKENCSYSEAGCRPTAVWWSCGFAKKMQFLWCTYHLIPVFLIPEIIEFTESLVNTSFLFHRSNSMNSESVFAKMLLSDTFPALHIHLSISVTCRFPTWNMTWTNCTNRRIFLKSMLPILNKWSSAERRFVWGTPCGKRLVHHHCLQVVLLKSLWDMISLVKTSIDDWRKTRWLSIDVEQMELDCRKFAKDIRSLDKEVFKEVMILMYQNFVLKFNVITRWELGMHSAAWIPMLKTCLLPFVLLESCKTLQFEIVIGNNWCRRPRFVAMSILAKV